MQKTLFLLSATVAFFLCAQAAQAGDSYSFVSPENSKTGASPATRGATEQQEQYKKYLANRAARKENATAEYQKLYDERRARDAEAPKKEEEQTSNQEETSSASEDDSAVTLQRQGMLTPDDRATAPVEDNNNGALGSTYQPKLGYPYTSE